MAGEAPVDQGKRPKKMPVLGLLFGLPVGFVVVWVTLNNLLESEPTLHPFLTQIAYLIGIVVGGGIGGISQLRTQRRTAETARFLRFLLGATLWAILFFGSMYLGGWLGERLFGRVGYFIGWFTTAILFFVVWFPRPSWSEQPSAPTSGPGGESPVGGKAKGPS